MLMDTTMMGGTEFFCRAYISTSRFQLSRGWEPCSSLANRQDSRGPRDTRSLSFAPITVILKHSRSPFPAPWVPGDERLNPPPFSSLKRVGSSPEPGSPRQHAATAGRVFPGDGVTNIQSAQEGSLSESEGRLPRRTASKKSSVSSETKSDEGWEIYIPRADDVPRKGDQGRSASRIATGGADKSASSISSCEGVGVGGVARGRDFNKAEEKSPGGPGADESPAAHGAKLSPGSERPVTFRRFHRAVKNRWTRDNALRRTSSSGSEESAPLRMIHRASRNNWTRDKSTGRVMASPVRGDGAGSLPPGLARGDRSDAAGHGRGAHGESAPVERGTWKPSWVRRSAGPAVVEGVPRRMGAGVEGGAPGVLWAPHAPRKAGNGGNLRRGQERRKKSTSARIGEILSLLPLSKLKIVIGRPRTRSPPSWWFLVCRGGG